MIVLDTNALRGGAYGPATSATLLRGLAAETGHQLALPQEVVAETLASFERELAPLVEAAEVSHLLERVPSWLGRSACARGVADASLPSLVFAVKERRESLTERPSTRFVILATPAGAADEGIAREKSRRPPATARGHEARDVVVWLTALEAAKTQRPSNVYFVSGDKTLCEEGTRRLRPELQSEAPSNFRFFSSIDALINTLSCEAEPGDELASASEVLDAIEQTALYGGGDPNHDLRRDVWDWAPDGVRHAGIVSATPALVSERDIRSRSCGDTTYTAIDAVYRLDLLYRAEGAGPVAVTVRLGVLVKHDEGDIVRVHVLARGGFRSHDPNDEEEPDGTE